MMDLKRFFLVPFDNARVSHGELKVFAEDHLGRMRGVNDSGALAGRFTAMISATEPVLAAFTAALSARDVAGANREGDTLAKKGALRAFKVLVRRREGLVRDTFGRPSPQYEAFFPRGLTGYNRATQENVETLMSHLVTQSTKFAAQLGPDMAAGFAAAKAAFQAARGQQTGEQGKVGGAIRARDAARDALSAQLMENVFDIARMFFRRPERCAEFFNQSLLRDRRPRKKRTAPPTPPPP